MKNQLTQQNQDSKVLSSRYLQLLATPIILLFLTTSPVRSQILAQWGFNGNNTGIAGPLTSLMPAVFSPSVTSTAYNSTVFYGEGGWPAAGLSPAHYFEFGLAPLVGNSLNIATIALTIRRSSTGTSGSGPTQFAIRSSIDGYTSDILTGNLTPSATTFTFSPGSSFISLLLGVRFRVYGYQAVISSGGLSRLVMENLQVNGIGTILPARIVQFGAVLRNRNVQVKYEITNNEPGTIFAIERSVNGTDYKTIDLYSGRNDQDQFVYSFDDAVQSIAGQLLYYRLRITFPSGQKIYSNVSSVDLTTVLPERLTTIQQGSTLIVRPTLHGSGELRIFNTNGQILHVAKAIAGNSLISVDLPQHPAGVYFIQVTNGKLLESTSVFLR
ncbi:MAG: T9SS type A sorting domain-containing protein [Chitinophagaceae bacterium]